MPDGDAARKAGGRIGCGSSRCLSRFLALVLIADGLITVAWGRGFLIRQRRLAPDWYKPVLDWLLGWPEPLLRLGAAIEAALGGLLLCSTERQMEKLTRIIGRCATPTLVVGDEVLLSFAGKRVRMKTLVEELSAD